MSTINGTSGNDTLNNTTSGNVILALAGDDTITNSGNEVSIDAGTGNDSVINQATNNSLSTGANVTISGGADDDFIENHGANALVNGDAGNDTVNNYSNGVGATLNGGAGNDSIRNSASAIISGGDGADSLINTNLGENSTINGDAGNDYILNGASSVSIDGGAGNDTLHSSENLQGITMRGGAGNDYLSNSASSKVYGGAGADSIVNSSLGANSTLSGDDGADYIQNAAQKVLINGSKGADTLYNSTLGANSTLEGGADNDSIRNYAASVQVDGGAGNDTLRNYDSANNSTLNAGAGDDSIYNEADKVYIDGDYGADYIYSAGVAQGVTINGGYGNDSLIGSTDNTYGVIYYYEGGGDYDTVYNYNDNDTISIGDNLKYQTLTSGSNVIVSIYGAYGPSDSMVDGSVTVVNAGSISFGSMTLYNAASKTLNIVGGSEVVTLSPGDDSITNYTKNTTVKGTADADRIYNYAGGVKILASAGNDYVYTATDINYTVNNSYGNVTVDAGLGDDFISNTDPNVSISGGYGNDTVSISGDKGNMTINGGAGNDYIDNAVAQHLGRIYQYSYGDGNDTITNYYNYDTISIGGSIAYNTLTSGDNIIVSIDSAAGQSLAGGTVQGSITLLDAKNKTLNFVGGTFKGVIRNSTSYTTIKGTSGNDSIENYVGNVKVSAGGGNDSIGNNAGDKCTLDGGAGNDTIDNLAADNVSVVGGDGDDRLYNSGNNVSLYGGAGDDSFGNNYTDAFISGGAGNDTVLLIGDKGSVTVNGGTGDDYINNSVTSHVGRTYQYASGDGNDTIRNYGADDTISISGSTKYDTLTSGNDIKVSIGSGSILLSGAGSRLVGLNIVGGTYSDGNKATLNVKNYTKNTTVKGTNDADYITNHAGGVKISAGGGNDVIHNETELGYLINNGYGYVTIDAGAGDDSIYSNDPRVSIFGGAGNDTVSLDGNAGNITVKGGTGNDYIYNEATTHTVTYYQYSSGDGNDTIKNYGENDIISIGGGASYRTLTSGNDIEVSVGSGSILLSGAKGKALNIYGGSYAGGGSSSAGLSVNGNVLVASSSFTGSRIYLDDYASNITNVNASAVSQGLLIYGTEADNYIRGGKGADTIDADYGNDTLWGGNGADIFIYSNGNDIITDYESVDAIMMASGSIKSSSIKGSNVILNISNGGHITVSGGKGKVISIMKTNGNKDSYYYGFYDYYSINSAQSEITLNSNLNTTLYSNYYPDSVKKIDGSKTTKSIAILGNAQNNTIKGGKGSNIIYGFGGNDWMYGGAGNDLINGGTGVDTLYGGDGNDTLYGYDGNDYLFGEEGNDKLDGGAGNDTLYGGVGNDTLYGGAGNDVFIFSYDYGNDVIADFESGDKIYLNYSSVSSAEFNGSDMVFTVKPTISGSSSSSNLTVKNAKDKEISIGSSIYYNYLTYNSAKTYVTLGSGFKGTLKASDYDSKVTFIDTQQNKNNLKIIGNSNNNTIYTGSGKVTVDGGAGNDLIWSGTGNDSLYGSAGNDVLYGNSGNNTLTGGAGNDTFVFSTYTKKDVVTDFADGDKISLRSGFIYSDSLSGSDMIFKIYNGGTFTIKNGKNKEIAIGYNIYYNNLIYNSNKTRLDFNSTFNGTLQAADYESSVVTISAEGWSKKFNINGNAKNNFIHSGVGADKIYGYAGNDSIWGDYGNDTLSGGSGNDSLDGGTGNDLLDGDYGNDTLTGGAGNDTFRYYANEGDDVITDYVAGQDQIYILNAASVSPYSSVSGSDVVIKVDNGSLTVKNGKNKEINAGDYIFYNNFRYNAKKTALTLGVGFSGTLKTSDYNSSVATINAYGLNNSIVINGNSKANLIYGAVGNDTIYGGAGNDVIYAFLGNDYIYGEDGNDRLFGLDGKDYLDGGAGNDVLYGYTGNDYLFGGNGNDSLFGDEDNDTLNGGAGNDTLTGGTGKDKFIFYTGGGSDVIADFTAGEDLITLMSGSVTSTSIKGSDVIFKVGSNDTLTVKNGKDKDIAIGSYIYHNDLIYNSSKTELTLGAGFSGLLDTSNYASTVTKIYATNVTSGARIAAGGKVTSVIGGSGNDNLYNTTNKAVYIDGKEGNDRLQGYPGNDTLLGGDGNDTLYGGYGSDTLTGGAGNDVFYDDYGGSDVITDYTVGQDTIKFSHEITGTIYSNTDVTFRTSVGSFTVKNGKGKNITITDSSGKTYTKLYTNGVTARTLDLLEDNNFMTDDTNLDSITEQKFSVTEIQNYNSDTFAQDSTLLTFAKDKK